MKKLLCLVLSVVMAFSCFGICLTASAAEYFERPIAVSRVLDPLVAGLDTEFSKGIGTIGYESADVTISEKNLKDRINKKSADSSGFFSADEKMFGINLDFLYNDTNSPFSWELLRYSLISNPNIHNEEIQTAVNNSTKSTCQMKSWYDACGEILYGYEYEYNLENSISTKSNDTKIYEDIIEAKTTVYNSYTGKNEIHYDYYYYLDGGKMSLFRANANYLVKRVVDGTIGNGRIIETKEKANVSAVKLINFIGNLLYLEFSDLPEGTDVFAGKKSVQYDIFFRTVAELSGLAAVLQSTWCNTTKFKVKDIMGALGVDLRDNVLLEDELKNGNHMGARILTDMYRGFTADPIGYVCSVLQQFCRNYSSYSEAFKMLFSIKFVDIDDRADQAGDAVDSYDGSELSTVDGLINFILDCIYFERIDKAVEARDELVDERAELVKQGASAKILADQDKKIADAESKIKTEKETKFEFAPLPKIRLSNAKDVDEIFIYLLCYFDINKSYNTNASMINSFISDSKAYFESKYSAETKSEDINNVIGLFNDIFTGKLSLQKIRDFYVNLITAEVAVSFPTNFMSTIKNAIANLINSFITTLDAIIDRLFGWIKK